MHKRPFKLHAGITVAVVYCTSEMLKALHNA